MIDVNIGGKPNQNTPEPLVPNNAPEPSPADPNKPPANPPAPEGETPEQKLEREKKEKEAGGEKTLSVAEATKLAEDKVKEAEDKVKKEYEDKNKKLYARTKKTEEAYKEATGNEYEYKEDTPTPEKPSSVNVFDFAKSIRSLKDYDEVEIDFIKTISESKSLSPSEVVETDEFKFFYKGRRDSIKNDKSLPDPSGSKPPSHIPSKEDISKMNPDQHKQLVEDDIRKQKEGGATI